MPRIPRCRLQLLVNNSHSLSLAHSKPTTANLSNSDATKRTLRPAASGLCVTSESSVQLDAPPLVDTTPSTSVSPQKPTETPARVMAVCEKMEDPATTAKMAGRELKIHAKQIAGLQVRLTVGDL